MRNAPAAVAFLLASLAVAGRARAEPPRLLPGAYAADRFTPASPGDHFLMVQGANVDGEQLFRTSLVLEDAYQPLVARNLSAPVLRDVLVLHASFSAAIWSRFLVSISVPFILVDVGSIATPASDRGERLVPPDHPDVGDVQAGIRMRLFSTPERLLETAMGVSLWSPTGHAETYAGDDSLRLFPYVAASGETSRFVYAARIGPIFQHAVDFVDVHVGTEVRLEVAAAWRSPSRRFEIGPELALDLPLGGGSKAAPTATSLEALASAPYRLGDLVIGAAAGPGILRGPGTPLFRGILSFAYNPLGDVDTDHDKIPDRSDACPLLKGVSSVDREVDGCPSDRDEDGIADAEDACPDKPGPRDPDATKNGCPPDRDGDGIADADDACPDRPGVDNVDPRKRGCPVDTDNDGIPDAEDACPTVAGPRNSDPKRNGCPAPKR